MDNDDSSSAVTFNSSKTQTVCTGFTSSTLEALYRNQSQRCQTMLQSEPSQSELIHMETQTAVEDLYFHSQTPF
jgi:hypothetical protein